MGGLPPEPLELGPSLNLGSPGLYSDRPSHPTGLQFSTDKVTRDLTPSTHQPQWPLGLRCLSQSFLEALTGAHKSMRAGGWTWCGCGWVLWPPPAFSQCPTEGRSWLHPSDFFLPPVVPIPLSCDPGRVKWLGLQAFPASVLGEGSGSPVLMGCWAPRQVPSLPPSQLRSCEGCLFGESKVLCPPSVPSLSRACHRALSLVILSEAVLGGVRNSN